MPLHNDQLCPEDEVALLLPAEKIPDGAIVCKRTGDKRYALHREIKLFRPHSEGETIPTVVRGLFIVSADRPESSIGQVDPGTMLHWVVRVDELHELLEEAIRGEPQ